MEEIEIKKITEINENNLNKITEWMYEWWGKDEMHTFIYPWLANVYVDEKYRNIGICRKLMESVKANARNNINSNELWLFTKHINLYEKFGWKYISDIDTYNKEQRTQRLYKLKLI